MTTTARPVDHYAALGVPRDATVDVVRAAYRERMRVAHPDAGGSVEQAQELNEALHVLTDPDRRARYDEALRVADGREARAEAAWGTARTVRFPARPAQPAEPTQPAPAPAAPPAPDAVREPEHDPEPEHEPEPEPAPTPAPARETRRMLVLPEPTVVRPPRFRPPRGAVVVLGCLTFATAAVGAFGIARGAAGAGWATLGLLAAGVASGWWCVRAARRARRVVAAGVWLVCGIAMTAVAALTTGVPVPLVALAFVAVRALAPVHAERRAWARRAAEAARATEAGERLRAVALEWDVLATVARARRSAPRWVEQAVSEDDGAETRVRLRSPGGRASAHVLHGLWPSGIWVLTDRSGTVHAWATEDARRTWERFATEVPA